VASFLAAARFTAIILLYGGNIYFLRLQIVRSISSNEVTVVVITLQIIGNNTEVLLSTTLDSYNHTRTL
jgi:hypothetical protein